MVRGGCEKCGSQTTSPRLCSLCRELEQQGFFNTANDQPEREERLHECTNCHTEYMTDGSVACPECGETRRRYVGPLPGGAPC